MCQLCQRLDIHHIEFWIADGLHIEEPRALRDKLRKIFRRIPLGIVHPNTKFRKIPEKMTIHINDTHPGLAIPELMRLLMDQEGLGWDEASWIVQHTVAYTNHTVLSEALEKWPEDMMRNLLPRIYMILQEINRRVCARLADHYLNGTDPRIAGMAITAYGQVHMANLCVAMSYSVNGVSQLHGDILKKETFHDYYKFTPRKFSAITNGITHRR